MKNELAGGRLPSGKFGANAAWWWITMLAFNLNAAMKRLVLGGSFLHRGLKSIRFHLIHIAARLVKGANHVKLRISRGMEALGILIRARESMKVLAELQRG